MGLLTATPARATRSALRLRCFQPDKDDLDDDANKNLHIGRFVYGHEATAKRHELAIQAAADLTSRRATCPPHGAFQLELSKFHV